MDLQVSVHAPNSKLQNKASRKKSNNCPVSSVSGQNAEPLGQLGVGGEPTKEGRADPILTDLRLTVEGMDPFDPLGREAAYGPSGAV